MPVQRSIQTCSLALFLALLWFAAFPLDTGLAAWLPVDLFLRLDPLVFVGTALAARSVPDRLWIALPLLVSVFFVGRIFCGYLCPMGATIDLADRLVRGKADKGEGAVEANERLAGWRQAKYHILLWVAGSGLVGVAALYWFAPMPLVTRLYGLVAHPTLAALAGKAMPLVRPLAGELGWRSLYFLQIPQPRFATQLLIVGMFIVIFGLARWSPRFWCRYLCPSGALFALFGQLPAVRRSVSDACIQCGRCQRSCPMDAISEDPLVTRHAECVACETCVRICPTKAVRFESGTPALWTARSSEGEKHRAGRRGFLFAAFAGVWSGALALSGLRSPHASTQVGGQATSETAGMVLPTYLIRPPGALPENDFLARCLRCGECMKACPTNTLQPILLESGFSAAFSPTVLPLRGPCEPLCNVCGQVCPSGALRPISVEDKTHVKIGTARVLRHKCLAWEQKKQCLVCDETCPYGAIELRRVPDNPVAVPFVLLERCAGCGFCEHHCPVANQRAIVIEPAGALRLSRGSYQAAGKAQGLSIELRKKKPGHGDASPAGYSATQAPAPSGGLPPGFSEPPTTAPAKVLPPGFSEPPATEQPLVKTLPPGFSEPPVGK